jgi:RNA 2',3'-cyclic 3'-phosphodiesterase
MGGAVTASQRLFFAVRPDVTAAASATSLANALREQHGLKGRVISAERLHITLHWLRDHDELPAELVASAMVAGGKVEMAPFDVGFDRVESLGDASHGGPLVLTGAAGLAPLRQFQRTVATAMTDAGIGPFVRTGFKPHMTLLYDDRYVARQAIDPIGWRVSEWVLVHSIVGASKHIVLGRWSLRSRQMGFGDW